jgi:hypothetical protein
MALTKITGGVIDTGTTITALGATFSGNVSVAGTLTYEDVTNVDSIGLITARNGVTVSGGDLKVGSAVTISQDNIFTTGIITATSFSGDGSGLTGVASTDNIRTNTNATFLQNINVSGTVTATSYAGDGSALTGIAVGIGTSAVSPTLNTEVILDLSNAQHHEVTLTAGITTVNCLGGSFGDSHSIVLVQPTSGITTVGFSTYFLFPSGSSPSMSQGSGKIDMISFVIRRQGEVGVATQLLSSAGLDYQ